MSRTRYRIPDGAGGYLVDIVMGEGFTYGGRRYPSLWLAKRTRAELEAFGFEVVDPTPLTLAERAALVTLSAVAFVRVLRPALVAKGYAPTAPLERWLMDDIAARSDADLATDLGLEDAPGGPTATEQAAAFKAAILDQIYAATEYDRADPGMDALGALYGFTPTEIDVIFDTAATPAA